MTSCDSDRRVDAADYWRCRAQLAEAGLEINRLRAAMEAASNSIKFDCSESAVDQCAEILSTALDVDQ